jgi:hypothetical protein
MSLGCPRDMIAEIHLNRRAMIGIMVYLHTCPNMPSLCPPVGTEIEAQ